MAGCNIVVYKGREFEQEEFLRYVKDHMEEFSPENYVPVDMDDISTDPEDFKTMPFKFSASRVSSGEKTITVRPQSYDIGTYRLGDKLYNVVPIGRYTLNEYLEQKDIKRNQFIRRFIGDEEIKYDHIREFLKGNAPMYIYTIQPIQNADDIMADGDPRFVKLHESKKAIIKSLRRQLKNETDSAKREVLTTRIQRLKDQVVALENDENRNIATIVDFMQRDMDSVGRVLDGNPDLRALDYANQLIYNYVNMLMVDFKDIVDTLDNETQASIAKLISDAIKLTESIKMHTLSRSNNKVKEVTGETVMLADMTIKPGKDVHDGIKWTLDTTNNINPIVQTLTKIIKDALEKLNIRYNSFKALNNKIVKELTKFQKAAGLKKDEFYEYMVQVDGEGNKTGFMVDRLRSDYYAERAFAHDTENAATLLKFYADNHNFKVNEEAWQVRKQILIEYFKSERATDVTLTDKEIDDGVTFEKKLQSAAEDYAGRRSPHLALHIINKYKKSPQAIDNAHLNSFMDFVKYGMGFEKVDGKRVQPLEPIATDDWVDSKWLDIQAMDDADPRKVFYNHFATYLAKGRDTMASQDFYLPWNYIPEKAKQLGIGDNIKQWWTDTISQNISQNEKGIDPFTGEIIRSIPKYMTSGQLSPENKSYNLGDVLDNFMKEAINFEEKSLIEDDANMLLMLLKEQKVYELNPDGTPKVVAGETQYKKGVSNNYQMAEYRLNAQLYDQAQDVELPSEVKKYDVAVQKEIKYLESRIKELDISEDEKAEALPWVDREEVYLGENDKIYEYIQICKRYKKVEGNFKHVTGNKIANGLIYYTSVKLLGLNLFGGVSELLQGTTSLFTESASGEFFTDREALSAFGDVISSLNPFGSDSARIRNLSKYFDVQGQVFQDGKSGVLGKIAFWQYEKANYLMNTSFLLAVLKHEKVKDKDGKEHSVEDIIEVDEFGNFSWTVDGITEDLHVANEAGESMPSPYLIGLMQKVKEVLKDNRERQTFNDPVLLEKNMIGRILGQFKKGWMFQAFYKRFATEQDAANLFSGKKRKGFYISFWDMMKNSIPMKTNAFGVQTRDYSARGIAHVPLAMLKNWFKFSMFGKLTGNGVKEGEFSEVDTANLRRFMRETTFIGSLMITALLLSSMGGGDDDLDPARKYFINQIIRLKRDMTTYMSPQSFASLFKNPAPLVGTFQDFFNVADAMIQSTVLMDPYVYEGTKREQLRIHKAVEKNVPFVNQMDRLLNKFEKVTTYSTY